MKRILSVILLFALSLAAVADEGMWTFGALPKEKLKADYGFELTPEWTQHVMRSSVRLSAGGSGSFVSANGLILTNHHVASDALHNISTPDADYIKSGFYAPTLEKEVQAPGLYVDQLVAFSDVTSKVLSSINSSMTEAQANLAKQAMIEKIQNSCDETHGSPYKCQVVTLYLGGAYHLYRYHRYSDIRIVFAPEVSIAFFGGDPDNFEFPRYDLDMTILRAYENGKPAQTADFLRWSKSGVAANELVFVTGNPGSTQRQLTLESLITEKAMATPLALKSLMATEKALIQFGSLSEESRRRAESDLFGVQNSRKVFKVRVAELTDEVVESKKAQEEALLAKLDADPALKHFLKAWEDISKFESLNRKHYLTYLMLEGRMAGINSRLAARARTLIRAVAEKAKPSEERLEEYSDSNLPQLEMRLFSKAPIYKDLEEAKLAASLKFYAEMLPYDPLLKSILQGKTPEARARELTANSALDRVEVRKEIYQGGAAALEKYKNDPMIQLAQLIDGPARAVRKIMEEQVQTPMESAYAKVAQARFAVYGDSVYPDATFTPRLTYGAVKGYSEGDQFIAPFTTMEGAYLHEQAHGAVDPFLLPDSWKKAKPSLDLSTPFNFVSTTDIIGGNSGSPTINSRGELVGLIFDGNIHSIMGDFFYDAEVNRAVSVDSRAMLHAMDKIYHAKELVAELVAGQN